VLFNGGYPTGDNATCLPEEKTALLSVMNAQVAAVNGGRRNLRNSRQLQTCSILCRGFAPDQCYVVYPSKCPTWRRLEAEDKDHSPDDVHLHTQDAALVDTSTRELQYDEITKKKCKTALKDIEQTVKTAVDWKTISNSCKKFLKQEVNLECFLASP
jgi:hypothetical protein